MRPAQWMSDHTNKVCLVLSTFTYLAYTNERLLSRHEQPCVRGRLRRRAVPEDRRVLQDMPPPRPQYVSARHPERRLRQLFFPHPSARSSTSGLVMSCGRPPARTSFSAGLVMIGVLEREGIPYEVLIEPRPARTRGQLPSRDSTPSSRALNPSTLLLNILMRTAGMSEAVGI